MRGFVRSKTNAEVRSEEGEPWEDVDAIKNMGAQKRTLSVTHGDTLSSLLRDIGVSFSDIDAISRSLSKIYNPKFLQIGQALELSWTATPNASKLEKMETVDSLGNRVTLTATATGYVVSIQKRVLQTQLKMVSSVIRSSFRQTAGREGLPQNLITETLNVMSPLVSPRRFVPGTEFELLYEEKVDASTGKLIGKRVLKYASFSINHESYRLYSFGNRYYNEKGESVKTEFLVMPLRGRIRVSSGFGYRKHPIFGRVKKHCGVDYAAKYGELVYASAGGVVTVAERYGGYGLYVKIRHSNGFETAYAHLSSISVRRGAIVSQGTILGRVGNSGSTTGSHLHHEVIRNHVFVDPQRYNNLGSSQLSGGELKRFNVYKNEIRNHLRNQKDVLSEKTVTDMTI